MADGMKVGLIARANRRGIGYQTQQFYENYPIDRTMLVLDGQKRFPEDPLRYPDAVIANVRNGEYQEVDIVKDWLMGLDIVFCVETPYEWELCNWARSEGARTVVQGNPEFYKVERTNPGPGPDLWGWPTPWLTDRLPPGKPLPVPITRPLRGPAAPLDDLFTVVHVAGHHAHGDRNGTNLFMHVLGYIRRPCRVKIYGQDGELPRIGRVSGNVQLELHPEGVEDRWDLYDEAHLLVLPRRYGGLSMPTLEAIGCGVVVAMTDCPPNHIWPVVPLQAKRSRALRVPFGEVRLHECNVQQMARTIDRLNENRDEWESWRVKSQRWAEGQTWDELRPVYKRVFAQAAGML